MSISVKKNCKRGKRAAFIAGISTIILTCGLLYWYNLAKNQNQAVLASEDPLYQAVMKEIILILCWLPITLLKSLKEILKERFRSYEISEKFSSDDIKEKNSWQKYRQT
jgi:uncharacterized membrane protein YidH (DUF202 family)